MKYLISFASLLCLTACTMPTITSNDPITHSQTTTETHSKVITTSPGFQPLVTSADASKVQYQIVPVNSKSINNPSAGIYKIN